MNKVSSRIIWTIPKQSVRGFLTTVRRRVYATLVVLAFSAPAFGQSLTGVVQKAKGAVVTIETYSRYGEPAGQGTGFFYRHDGQLITNFHVLSGSEKAFAVLPTGRRLEITHVLASDANTDLVIARANLEGSRVKYLSVERTLPEIGEEIVVVGSPLGLEQTVSPGIVSAHRISEAGVDIIQITAPVSPGSSGSPVLNVNGDVIGVVTSLIRGGQNLNFAVGSSHLVELRPATPEALTVWAGQFSSDSYAQASATEDESSTIILNDRFIDNRNSWSEINDQKRYFKVLDNRYRMINRTHDIFLWAFKDVHLSNSDNFIITISFKKNGPTDGLIALLWGADRDINCFFFGVDNNHRYALGSITNLTGWEAYFPYTKNNHINSGPLINRLTIMKEGDVVDFFVNRKYVQRIPFEPMFGSRIGIGIDAGVSIDVFEVFVGTF